MPSPFKLDTGGGPPRTDDGRFARPADKALPPNPDEAEQHGHRPEAWAPGVGQNSAAIADFQQPWPPADNSEIGKPMRLSK